NGTSCTNELGCDVCVGGSNAGGACASASACPGGTCDTTSASCPNAACSVPGVATRPNACTGGPSGCTPIGGNDGECNSGPSEKYCTNESYRGCATNADCPAAGDSCNPTPVL